jgi:hypothetical protein
MSRPSITDPKVTNDPNVKRTPDSNPVRSNLVSLDPIIGFPPYTQGPVVMKNLQENAIPLVLITPCVPDFQMGMTLFSAKPQNDEYRDLVRNLGYIVTMPLTIAFIPDVPVSETITNEYGESFLNRMTDVVSSGFSEINQILGKKKIEESARQVEEIGKAAGGMVGGAMRLGGAAGLQAAEAIKAFGNAISKGTGDLASKLLAGGRIDFPFVWKNSAYSITTSVTVRLYNPKPGVDSMHERYIVGPLVALLALATPTSDHMNVYSWPFFHKIKCPGYFNIDPGTITSISVTRGAENQISWGQRPSLVDVRIDFGSLHSVMLNSIDPASANRPSIIQLRNSLLQKRHVYTVYMKPQVKTDSTVTVQSDLDKNLELVKSTKNASAPVVVEKNLDLINKRVSQSDIDKASSLAGQSTFYG